MGNVMVRMAQSIMLCCVSSFLFPRVLISPSVFTGGDRNNPAHDFPSHEQRIDAVKAIAGISQSHRFTHSCSSPVSSYGHVLRHNPKMCKTWSAQDYCLAVMELYSQNIPIHTADNRLDGYIICGVSADGSSYICLHDDYRLHVMQETNLYELESFWSYVQQFDDYHLLLPEIYHWVHAHHNASKQLSSAGHAALSQKYAQWVQAERTRIEQMQKTYGQMSSNIDDQATQWTELMEHSSGVGLQWAHLQSRLHAYHATKRNLINNQKKYSVSSDVAVYLQNKGYKSRLYTDHYGNQLQHALHQECISMATQTVRLPVQSMLYPCKDAVLDIVDASREFNQLGQSHKTTTLNDFVHALLDCGSAIMEGVAQGIIIAAQDIMDHPVQTALCLVAGEYILAYQLAKVTTQLACIGITYMIDEEAGARSWNDYIQPLRTVIADLTKEELNVRDRIKGVATFGTALVAQHKMLRGLGSLYNCTKLKAIEFAKKNPLIGPQEYMATPEGLIFKATAGKSQRTVQEMRSQKLTELVPRGNLGYIASEVIESAVSYVINNKMVHIFDKIEHNLEPLVTSLGSREKIVRTIVDRLHYKLPACGVFQDIPVEIEGFIVYVRGRVVNGTPKIGTFFIK